MINGWNKQEVSSKESMEDSSSLDLICLYFSAMIFQYLYVKVKSFVTISTS